MPDEHNLPSSNLHVDAVYEDGVIKPLTPLDLPPGTQLRLQIDRRVTVVAQADAASASLPQLQATSPIPQSARWVWPAWVLAAGRYDLILLTIGVLIYLVTHFAALDRFPIYFFADEAVQTLNADELLHQGLRDFTGTLLPPYFLNVDKWSLGLTVYIQLIGVALFGKSVIVTRAVSALVGALTVVAITVMLRLVFPIRLWWVGPLVLAALPVWFLHARTAFETVMMVAFYACFLCCYLLYRYRDPRYLFGAIICGGATFYSYSNGQGVMLVTSLLLLLSDWGYHWSQRRNWRLIGWSALLVVLLMLPYLRFQSLHPEAVEWHLHTLNSYWIDPIPFREKLSRFLSYYERGLSPIYWFTPNDTDLIRHRMGAMGHLRIEFLPLAALGVWVCARNWRSAAHRLIFVALLAAPFSAALVGIEATRVLAMVVPATLLITLGIDYVFEYLRRWVRYGVFSAACCLVLVVLSLTMLRSALVDGPTWFPDYGMGGMQYGAQQLFTTVGEELDKAPERRLEVSPTWVNGTDLLARFFLTPQQFARISLNSIDTYTTRKTTIPPAMIFVLPPDEYARAMSDPKLVLQPPERVLPFPDGSPGFYFVQISYSPQSDELFAAEQAARLQPVVEEITLDGQPVQVRYSPIDMGELKNIFDGNPVTLMRGMEANPFLLELHLSTPRPIREIALTVATMDFRLVVTAILADGKTQVVTKEYRDVPNDPREVVTLPNGSQMISTLRLEISSLNVAAGEPANIHIRELEMK